MSDLRTDAERMSELYSHLARMESVINHFYCDHRGLVTIGIGYLVDRDGAADTVGADIARTLARRTDVRFTRNGVGVGVEEVAADWQRVKSHGRSHPNDGARQFSNVAQLRVSDLTVRGLTTTTIRTFADALYRQRPFVIEHDPRVAMALIDARYNPAGVPLYSSSNPDIPRMWNALNPWHEDFDPKRGIALFESIWAHKKNVVPRYIQRHFLRVQWMMEGLKQTGLLA